MNAFQSYRLNAVGNAIVTSGSSILGTVNVNTGGASAVLTIYDGTSASGIVKAVIDASTKSSHGYLILCSNGIYIALSGNDADVTIGYT
jgi:hypothetical protein